MLKNNFIIKLFDLFGNSEKVFLLMTRILISRGEREAVRRGWLYVSSRVMVSRCGVDRLPKGLAQYLSLSTGSGIRKI